LAPIADSDAFTEKKYFLSFCVHDEFIHLDIIVLCTSGTKRIQSTIVAVYYLSVKWWIIGTKIRMIVFIKKCAYADFYQINCAFWNQVKKIRYSYSDKYY
jgi:hypothetical protein